MFTGIRRSMPLSYLCPLALTFGDMYQNSTEPLLPMEARRSNPGRQDHIIGHYETKEGYQCNSAHGMFYCRVIATTAALYSIIIMYYDYKLYF